MPFNFQIGADRAAIALPVPHSAAGELEVRLDDCQGEPLAVLFCGGGYAFTGDRAWMNGHVFRADSAGRPVSWVRAEGAIAGLRVRAFTAIPVQHNGDLPLACNDADQIAEAATPSLPAGWRWLTSLDTAAVPAAAKAV